MKKINFICPPMSGNGGTETVLTKVLNYYSLKSNYEINITLSNYPENINWLKSLNTKINIMVCPYKSKLKKQYYFTKIFINEKNNSNLIMLGANMIKLAAIIRKIYRKNYRIISWIHYSLFNQNMFNPKNIMYADYHLAISSIIKNQLIQLGSNIDKVKLIYNPIEHNNYRSIKNVQNMITYIGRIQLYGQKNMHELIDSFQFTSNMKLSIFGVGDDLEVKKYIKKINIEKRIKWYGWQNNPWKFIEDKTLAIILTSKFEGLPMVFLEALSRGIPVISSKFEGYNDVVINNINGLTYPVGDSDKLYQNLKNIHKIVNEYTPQKISQSISKFYYENYFKNLTNIFQNILI